MGDGPVPTDVPVFLLPYTEKGKAICLAERCSPSYFSLFYGEGFFSNDRIRGLANQAVREREIAMVENKEVGRESVARRAYDLYVERGAHDGSDVEDWLRAEKELSPNPVTTPAKSDKTQNKTSRAN